MRAFNLHAFGCCVREHLSPKPVESSCRWRLAPGDRSDKTVEFGSIGFGVTFKEER
jgi:hypothetical protein